jgi:hypothetical protein
LVKQDENASVIHYTGAAKPWITGSNHLAGSYFFDFWSKTPWRKDFDLQKPCQPVKKGVSLITICDDVTYLDKSLKSWLDLQQIREIIIVDNTNDRKLEENISSIPDDRIILVRVNNGQQVPYQTGINLGVRASSLEIILKVDPDVILYKDFFDKHPLRDQTFYNLLSWKDWFIKKEYLLTVFFMYREDFILVNGYHRSIPSIDGDSHFFDRLMANNLQNEDINPDLIYCQSKDRQPTETFDPLPEFKIPLVNTQQKLQLQKVKGEVLLEHHPWNLLHPILEYKDIARDGKVLTLKTAVLLSKEEKLVYPLEEIFRKALITNLPELLSKNTNLEQIIREPDIQKLQSKNSIFSDPMTFLLLSQNNFNNSTGGKLHPEYIQLEKEHTRTKMKLDKVYNSYSWKIGSALICTLVTLFGWLPPVKKRLRKQ